MLTTGNYPSSWVTDRFADAVGTTPLVMIDTLPNRLSEQASVILPSATWLEKSGTFENVSGRLQSFNRAITPMDFCKNESQIALELIALLNGTSPAAFDPAHTRSEMASVNGLASLADAEQPVETTALAESDLELVDF